MVEVNTIMRHNKDILSKGLNVSFTLFLLTSVFQLNPIPLTTSDVSFFTQDLSVELCYGFYIPLPSSEIIAENPDVQLTLMNLINDLLRLQIPVYWLTDSINIKVQEINTFQPSTTIRGHVGSFLIPFTNISTTDSLLIAVIYDYNQTHELHIDTQPLTIFQLSESLILPHSYKLIEPRIAYYYGDGVYSNSLNWYVTTLYHSGFLSNTYLDDDEVITTLNPDEYNVFIWPGGEIIEDIQSDIDVKTRIRKQNSIKEFVADGGGYIGSCYGAFAASSGTRFFPFPLLSYYTSSAPSIGFLSIQDCFTALGISCSINITVSVDSHPVLFGVNGTLHDSQLRGGAVYTWLGPHTKSLGVIEDVNSTIWTHWFRDLFSSNKSIAHRVIDLWVRFTQGKTVWTTSEYGAGKVVTFGDHPEIGSIDLKRVVHNAVFYVSSEHQKGTTISFSLPASDIQSVFERSRNLTISNSTSGIFSDVLYSMDQILNEYEQFLKQSESIGAIIWDMIENETMDMSIAIGLFVSGLWEFRGTMDRSIYFLDTTDEIENIRRYLLYIDSIGKQLSELDHPIDRKMNLFKEDMDKRLIELEMINKDISTSLETLTSIIEDYDGSSYQNDTLLLTAESIWGYSKQIEKTCPQIFFQTLGFLRETWYTYEAI